MELARRIGSKLWAWTVGPRPSLVTKAAAEFTGCALFHFIGSSSPTPIVNAVTLVVMVYYTAKLSGGHLNPALTTTFALLGYTNPVEVLVYWVSQVSGSIIGALMVAALSSNLSIRGGVGTVGTSGSGCFVPNPSISALQVIGWEAMCTFSFILPIFSVVWYTQSKSGYGNTGPIIVGLSLYAAASAASQWTGGVLNPARALASSVVFDCRTPYLGYYVLGEFIGAASVPLAVIPWYGVAADDGDDDCQDECDSHGIVSGCNDYEATDGCRLGFDIPSIVELESTRSSTATGVSGPVTATRNIEIDKIDQMYLCKPIRSSKLRRNQSRKSVEAARSPTHVPTRLRPSSIEVQRPPFVVVRQDAEAVYHSDQRTQ